MTQYIDTDGNTDRKDKESWREASALYLRPKRVWTLSVHALDTAVDSSGLFL